VTKADNRRHDVSAVADPAVDQHRSSGADRLHDLGQGHERSHRAVQLTSTVVGHHDPVGPGRHELPRVVRAEHPLDQDAARPHLAQPPQVVDGDRRVEHAVDEVRDRAAALAQRRELKKVGGQQVGPPARVHAHVGQRAQPQGRGNGQTVADISQPTSGHGSVGREHQGAVSGSRSPLHQLGRLGAIAPQVELEPTLRIRRFPGHLLHRHGPHGRQGVGDTSRPRRAHDGELALMVHHPGEAGGRESQRQRRAAPPQRGGGVDLAQATQHPGVDSTSS
jgi:hypothetical protein